MTGDTGRQLRDMLSPHSQEGPFMHATEPVSQTDALNNLTARESELLHRAGERVFALSRRLAERDKEVERLTSDMKSLRELLAENRNIREILSAQITSLQAEHEREYEERSELRRLVAGLHLQLQEVIPMMMRQQTATLPAATAVDAISPARSPEARRRKSLSRKFFDAAEREFQLLKGGSRPRRR